MDDTAAARRIIAAYADAENWILEQLAAAVERGALGTATILQGRADVLDELLMAVAEYLQRVEDGLEELTLASVQQAVATGAAEALATIPTAMSPVAATLPTATVEALALASTTTLTSQRTQILRSTRDAYQRIIQQAAITGTVSGASIEKRIQLALNRFADEGITGFVDNAGRRWGMDTYSRMALRTTAQRAANEARYKSFTDNNISLVRTTWHHGSHPWCAPYQGKVLSLDGMAGVRSVQDRTTGEMIEVHVTATLDEAISNGYKHIACRHSEQAYIPGFPLPNPPEKSEKQIQDEYDATQKQRYNERAIRRWKGRAAVALSPEDKAQANRKVTAWQRTNAAHVKQWDHLSRDYNREK